MSSYTDPVYYGCLNTGCCSALQRFLRTSSSWIMVGAAAFCFVLLLEVCMNLYMYRFLVNPPARLVATKAKEKVR